MESKSIRSLLKEFVPSDLLFPKTKAAYDPQAGLKFFFNITS